MLLTATTPTGGVELTGIAAWVVSLMEALGAPGAGIAIAVENLFPPIPSEVILPLAGFTASQGTLNFWAVLIWTTVGSVVGALALYGLGAWLGRERLRKIVDKVPGVKLSDVDRVESWFAKHGTKAVLFGRMIPLFRSLISIPAGIERMSIWKFTLLTLIGSLIWNALFITLGFYLGENWAVVGEYMDPISNILYVIVAAAIVYLIVRMVLRARREKRERAAEVEQQPRTDV